MSDDIMIWALGIALLLLAFIIFIIRIGMKGSRDNLISPPSEEELKGKSPGERTALLPERPDVTVDAAPSVLNPDRPKDDGVAASAAGAGKSPRPSPWEGDEDASEDQPAAITGAGEVESSYSDDQMMEREIKAMLLQDRPDRAVKHVMQAKACSQEEAEAIVAGFAEG